MSLSLCFKNLAAWKLLTQVRLQNAGIDGVRAKLAAHELAAHESSEYHFSRLQKNC